MKTVCGYPGCGLDTGSRPYSRSGIPSVTTIIDLANFDDKARKFSWAAGEKAAVAAVHRTQDWWEMATTVRGEACSQDHKVEPGLCPACKYLRSQFHWDTEKKKHLGSHLHHLALSWALGEDIVTDELLDPYIDGLEGFYELYKPQWEGLEQTVYMHSTAREYVGTFDALAVLECPIHSGTQCRWLLDIKTGMGRWLKEWALQLAAYRYANEITEWRDGKQFARCAMPMVAHTGVIWLRDTGEAELIEVLTGHEEWNQFQRLLDVWKWSHREDAKAAKAKKDKEKEAVDATV